ncbi:MAG: DMT family transporter [Myxococcota bacterium]
MSSQPTKDRRVFFALLIAVTAISFAAIFFRKSEGTHPLVAAGIRLLIAAVLLSPLVVRGLRRKTFDGRALRLAALAGLAYAAHFGTWVWSLSLTTVAASVTLVTATPLLLAVYAVVRGKDQPARHHWFAVGLALIGVSLIGSADSGNPSALVGDGLAFVGAASMAVYMLLARHAGEKLDVWAFTGVATFVGAVVLLSIALVGGVPIAFESEAAFFYIVLAALVPQIIGHSLLTWSLRHTRPTVVGIATVGEPVGSAFLGWLWLGEHVGLLAAIGCLVTIGAVVLALVGGSSGTSKPRKAE